MNFEVENEIQDIFCYVFFSSTCQEDQNYLLNKTLNKQFVLNIWCRIFRFIVSKGSKPASPKVDFFLSLTNIILRNTEFTRIVVIY